MVLFLLLYNDEDDGMMVLGVTQRYKEKSFTTVFYGVVPTTI